MKQKAPAGVSALTGAVITTAEAARDSQTHYPAFWLWISRRFTVTCHNCRIECKRKGHDRKGNQRYQCRQCSKTFLEPQEKPLDGMYLPMEKAEMVLSAPARRQQRFERRAPDECSPRNDSQAPGAWPVRSASASWLRRSATLKCATWKPMKFGRFIGQEGKARPARGRSEPGRLLHVRCD